MDKKTIILIIVAGLVIFIIGGGLGIFYQKQTTDGLIKSLNSKSQAMDGLIKSLNSKTITSITALGKVVSINGNKIVLTSGQDNLEVIVSNGAKVYSLVKSPPAQATLKDIKTGDNISVNVKLLPNGQLEGRAITIFPAQAK